MNERFQSAIDDLTHHQVQCDEEGVMIQVSREALHIALTSIDRAVKTAPTSQYQTELLARARARIARSRVQYGDKVAYPDDMQLMLDLVGQIESLTSALQVEYAASPPRSSLDKSP